MGKDRDRNNHGRYDDRIEPNTVLEVFDAREDYCRPLTAGDVVDELGIARRTAHNKLNALVERGVLETRKVGARGRVWWVPSTADEHALRDGREAAESAPDVQQGVSDADAHNADERRATAVDPEVSQNNNGKDSVTLSEKIDEVLDGWRPGRNLEKREQQRPAGRAALEYLRDRGEAQASEFQRDVEPEHPVEGQSPETWWKNTARPALKRAQEQDVVEFQDGAKLWRWTGE